jgi:long-chain acyl-CoA synthetase
VPLIIEKIYKTKVYPQLTATLVKRALYKMPLTRKVLHKIAVKKIYAAFGGQLHFFGIGGALLSPEVELFLREGKFPYAIGYGLTETSPLIAGTDAQITRFRSTGKVIPGVEVKLAEKNEKGEGEVLVRGDNVMKGYFKDKLRTKEAFTKDGWFRTGDLAKFGKDGYLYIKGRRKNMIVGASGENIYPEEIEANLNKSDYVLESLVYEDNGLLTARVYLNYEELDKEMQHRHLNDRRMQIYIENKLQEIRRQVNANVSSFSKIKRIKEQPEPFEKTPTKKIKRYLYV